MSAMVPRWVLPLAVAAAALVSFAAAPPAGAAAPASVAAGWWWRLRPSATLPAPPSPAGDGLMVQGAPDGPVAIAALRAAVGPDERATALTLRVQPGFEAAGDGAVIVACRAASPWEPETAGAWDRRPDADCSVTATGLRAPDGTAFTFDLTSLGAPGRPVDIVLVPGTTAGPAGTNGSVFTAVFARPTPADLMVSGAAPAMPSLGLGAAEATPAAAAEPDDGGAERARIPEPSGAALDLGPAPVPATGSPPAGRPSPVAGRPRPEQAARPARTAGADHAVSGSARAWAAVVILAGMAVTLWSGRRPVPAPRVLVALADRRERPTPPVPAGTGGLGRFRRPRTRPPQPLV